MSNLKNDFFNKNRTKVFEKIYIANVRNRLRELVNPNDADCKRWIWELVQNAKDSISGQPGRKVDIELNVDSDTYIFKHNGSPFNENTLFGLLYKYSEGKTNNYESTGRFGTGFLTTHSLSKTVEISGDLIPDGQTEPTGFSVTMYREGEDSELLEGLRKTEDSLRYEKPFHWTTYKYKAVTKRNKEAGQLGIKNFKDNIDKVMLFCPEINSIKLNDNGKILTIERSGIKDYPEYKCQKITFIVNDNNRKFNKIFLYSKIEEYNEWLTIRFNKRRNIRICCAIELDSNNDIYINTSSPGLFCSLPLVGSEVHEFPFIINSQDFEPDSERQSIFLAGNDIDEKTGKISDPGINRMILNKSHNLYKNLLGFICDFNIGKRYMAARGLRSVPHVTRFFDRVWYKEYFIKPMREILISFPIIWNGSQYKKISELKIPNYDMTNERKQIYDFISEIYNNEVPSYDESINIEKYLWSDDENIDFVDIEDCVISIDDYENITTLQDNINEDVWEWLDSFLSFIKSYYPTYLERYAIIPNMNKDFVKLNQFLATSKYVPKNIIECLEKLDINWKERHIHKKIKKYSPGTDHKISIAVSEIRDTLSEWSEEKVLTLIQYIPYDCEDTKFIQKRKNIYELCSVIWENYLSGEKDGSKFPEDLWNGIDEMVFDKLLLEIQESKKIDDKISVEFINKVLKCFSQYFQNFEINEYSFIPNQNNKLCSINDLYEDIEIPEILKDCLKNCFGEDIRENLINKEIETRNLKNIITTREITDYRSTLKKYFLMDEEMKYNRYSRTYSKYVPRNSKIEAAKYLIRIVHNDSHTLQRKLFNLYQVFIKHKFSEDEYCVIDNKYHDIWDYSNKYIYEIIRNIIEKNDDVNSLAINLGKSENEILKYLKIFINNFPIKGKIVPNQYSEFCEIAKLMNEGMDNIPFDKFDSDIFSDSYLSYSDTLYEDSESDNNNNNNIKLIPKELKDIAKYLGYDVRAGLVHKSIGRPCSRSISYEDICKKIDELIEKKHKNKDTYKDKNFKKAAYILLEKYFKTMEEIEIKKLFPYSYLLKNNIIIDVVIDESARETLVNIGNTYDDDEIKELLKNSNEIKQFLKTIKRKQFLKIIHKDSSQSIVIGSGPNSERISRFFKKYNNRISYSNNEYYYSGPNSKMIDEIYNIIYKILDNSNEFNNVILNKSNIKIETFGYEFFIKVTI
ncbi:hypothetical protein H8356DRAFT_1708124 [Neocallimastix lanati (nom. inval.)]|nr:hypothetical protein H8356DRAFT_1708124 [Neocallimastix sp. JGI-2020a]